MNRVLVNVMFGYEFTRTQTVSPWIILQWNIEKLNSLTLLLTKHNHYSINYFLTKLNKLGIYGLTITLIFNQLNVYKYLIWPRRLWNLTFLYTILIIFHKELRGDIILTKFFEHCVAIISLYMYTTREWRDIETSIFR